MFHKLNLDYQHQGVSIFGLRIYRKADIPEYQTRSTKVHIFEMLT